MAALGLLVVGDFFSPVEFFSSAAFGLLMIGDVFSPTGSFSSFPFSPEDAVSSLTSEPSLGRFVSGDTMWSSK